QRRRCGLSSRSSRAGWCCSPTTRNMRSRSSAARNIRSRSSDAISNVTDHWWFPTSHSVSPTLCGMSWPQTPMPAATTTKPGTEPYLPVEEVARRLDLPLGILLRRVEAGDVPSRREDGPDGVHFLVRLGDLGIESPAGDRPTTPLPPPARDQQTIDQSQSVDVVGTAQQPAAQQQPAPAALAS